MIVVSLLLKEHIDCCARTKKTSHGVSYIFLTELHLSVVRRECSYESGAAQTELHADSAHSRISWSVNEQEVEKIVYVGCNGL